MISVYGDICGDEKKALDVYNILIIANDDTHNVYHTVSRYKQGKEGTYFTNTDKEQNSIIKNKSIPYNIYATLINRVI